MADSEVDTTQQVADSEVDTTQQGTSQTAATKPKNPKRVAVGKAAAEKTKLVREAQKKALSKAQTIIANNQIKTDPPAAPEPPVAPEPPAITTTQWLSVISIIVSLAGIYYKREEIKGVFTKPPPSPVLPRASPPSPRGGNRMMD